MGDKQDPTWHLTGTIVESVYNLGNRGKPHWQIFVRLKVGFLTIDARGGSVRSIAENSSVGQRMEKIEAVELRKVIAEPNRLIFLDHVDQLSPNDQST
jgi:hypothetical protein